MQFDNQSSINFDCPVDNNVVFKIMSITASKSWVDLLKEQNLQYFTATLKTQNSSKLSDTTAKYLTKKSTRNRCTPFKLRL